MSGKDLLPQVTIETMRASSESLDDNPQNPLVVWLEQMTKENPLITHEIMGWAQEMLRMPGNKVPLSTLLFGPTLVYHLLRVQAESDSIKIPT